jgi:septal ring factor EnvC (AmiA/AmiB activator)
MQITKEFLETEIRDLETETQKAQTFLIQAQATIQAYKMLINRLDAAEPEMEQQDGTDIT